MNTEERMMIVSNCPTVESIRSLATGALEEATALEVSLHLTDCVDCQNLLRAADQGTSDSLLKQLRQPNEAGAYRNESECDWAIARAISAGVAPGDEETFDEFPCLPADLGDYRLMSLIARGGMGAVYFAHHQRLSRDVAVKVISGKRLTDARSIQRFEAETRAIGRLSHPNIVTAMDAREINGLPVLVMEYVDGLDLGQIVHRLGALPSNIVAAVGQAVASALEYASRNGLVHRDIKPSNIMVSRIGEIKLLDLGLARIRFHDSSNSENTQTGLTVGTADYMSPEQINDARQVDVRSDLYSLGCTLYKLLVGRAPYSGPDYATNFAKLSAHVASTPIPWPEEIAMQNPVLVDIVDRLLVKDVAQRADNAQQIAIAFEPHAKGADLRQLVELACLTMPTKVSKPTPSRSVSRHASMQGVESNRGGRTKWPSWLAWSLAAAGLPFGFIAGIWLTITQHNGESNRLQLPSNASAQVTESGDVVVQLDPDKKISPTSLMPQDAASPPSGHSKGYATGPAPSNNPGFTTASASDGLGSGTKESDVVSDEVLQIAVTNAMEGDAKTFRSIGFLPWLTLLEKEQSAEILALAAEATIALADSPPNRRKVAENILKRCRTLWTKRHDSPWMSAIPNHFYHLLPEPGLEVMLEEFAQGNLQSKQAMASIVHSWLFENDYVDTLTLEAVESLEKEYVERLIKVLIESSKVAVERQDLLQIATYLARVTEKDRAANGLPSSILERSRGEWESKLHNETGSVIYDASDAEAFGLWIPHWRTLDADQQVPRTVIASLLSERRCLRDWQIRSILHDLEIVDEADLKAILVGIVQQVETSNFDFSRAASDDLFPRLMEWLVEEGHLSQETGERASRLLETTRRTVYQAQFKPNIKAESILQEPCEELRRLFQLPMEPASPSKENPFGVASHDDSGGTPFSPRYRLPQHGKSEIGGGGMF